MKKFYLKIILENGFSFDEVVAKHLVILHNYYHFYDLPTNTNNFNSTIAVAYYPIDKTIIYKIEELK